MTQNNYHNTEEEPQSKRTVFTFSCSVVSNTSHARLPALHHLLEFLQTRIFIVQVMPSHHLILCCPRLLPPSVFSSTRLFSNESALHIRWPKYWSFSFSISPYNEYSGLISFRIHWFDLLAVQGTLKSLLQHHSSKTSILWTQFSLWYNSYLCT